LTGRIIIKEIFGILYQMRPRIEQASLLAGVRSTDRKGTAKCDYAYVLGAKSKNINKTNILVRNVKV